MAQTEALGKSGRLARTMPWLVVGAWMTSVLVAFWFFELRSAGALQNAQWCGVSRDAIDARDAVDAIERALDQGLPGA
jgi:hypothetical protein